MSSWSNIYGRKPLDKSHKELMEAIQVLAPNLYEATIEKLNNI